MSASTAPIEALEALLVQCKSEGRQQSLFRVSAKPKAWLDWSQCQRARLAAETALAKAERSGSDDAATKLKLTRDACLLTLLK